MFDFLKQHALKSVWCTPNQDNQVVFQLPRITGINGELNRINVMWETLALPTNGQRYHVYQIGGVPLRNVNLFGGSTAWRTLASSCNEGENMLDCYYTSGIQLPKTQVFSLVTELGNVLIAVPKIAGFESYFNSLDIYLRIYSNAYFESDRSMPFNEYVEIQGKTIANTQDVIDLQTFFNAKGLLHGQTYAFVNGFKVPSLSLVTAGIGDTAEVVYDSSIYKTVDFPVANLLSFDSTLDNKGKYVLHYSGVDANSIDYFDDIDLYLLNVRTGKGVYMHKNAVDAVRMLSHRDYAVPVAYVQAWSLVLKGSGSAVPLSDLTIRMHVRKSGWQRPLVAEHHRIKDLYELQDADLKGALVGVNANVSVWNAASLEASAYPLLMRSDEKDITRLMVQNAYGYHGVATIVADTPIKRDMARSLLDIPVPYLLAYDSTVSEYDANGLLIGSYKHNNGFSYQPRNTGCTYAEMLSGFGSEAVDDNFDLTQSYQSKVNYRFYLGDMQQGSTRPVWTDVTGTNAYSIAGNTITWAADTPALRCMRSDKQFLQYSFETSLNNGLIVFNLQQKTTTNGISSMRAMQIPMGELDIFMNGRVLIEGLDYAVTFPMVVVCNRQYLVNPQTDTQKFTVRFTGFCTSTLQRTPPQEFGFIKHGKLSQNSRYNLHLDRVQRVQVGGRLYVKEELSFNERALTYVFDSVLNGKPYLIKDIVVPMRDLVDENTYSFRAKSLLVDNEISDYLTIKLPEAVELEPNPVIAKHSLYSPFICKIVFDLLAQVIDKSIIENQYDDNKLRQLVAPYLYLLEFDPIHIDRALDEQYVIVQPHFLSTVIDVDLSSYRFLKRVVEMYGNDKVNLSALLRLV